jgi:subtilisin family serine protease
MRARLIETVPRRRNTVVMHLPRRSIVVALVLAAAAAAPAAARADDAPLSDQIIVRHQAGMTATERADVRSDADTTLEETMRPADTELVAVEEGTRAEALAELRRDPDVVWAAPNLEVRSTAADPYWPYLYGLTNDGLSGKSLDADVDAPQAWAAGYLGTGVTVAVVDSGIKANHEDLAGRLDMARAWDFYDNDATPQDINGHGTHVSGIVAANLGNGLGVAGIAPGATVLPLRALGSPTGTGPLSAVLNAFAYAGQSGVRVVNASLGVAYNGSAATAVDSVISQYPNTLYVVAAGNEAIDNDSDPDRSLPCVSALANVLCVGASDANDVQADFSNYGATSVDLFAPGVDILSSWPYGLQGCDSPYCFSDGTSMASPYVAGAAALVAQRYPGYSASAIAQALKGSVDPVAGLASSSLTGGRLNVARAVGAAVDAANKTVVPAATGGVASATVSLQSAPNDVVGFKVYDARYTLLGSSTSGPVTVNGLAGGTQTFTVLASYSNGRTSPAASATATVTPAPPAPPAVAPAPSVAPVPAAPAPADVPPPPTTTSPLLPVSGLAVVTRSGRRSVVFRVARTTRITVTLLRLRDGRYRRTDSRTLRMAAGLQSLPLTSRLLGMRVPRGRWKVKVGTGTTAVATAAFTRR